MSVLAQRIGDGRASLGLLVIIGMGCLLLFIIHLRGRK